LTNKHFDEIQNKAFIYDLISMIFILRIFFELASGGKLILNEVKK